VRATIEDSIFNDMNGENFAISASGITLAFRNSSCINFGGCLQVPKSPVNLTVENSSFEKIGQGCSPNRNSLL